MTRYPYNMMDNDFEFIGPLGKPYVYRFLSRNPREIQNYLTLLKPFDENSWALIATSVISVVIALVCIDTTFASWSKTSRRGILLQSIILYTIIYQNNWHNYLDFYRHWNFYWSCYRWGHSRSIYSKENLYKCERDACAYVVNIRIHTHNQLQVRTSV